jgi:hypothetical protein
MPAKLVLVPCELGLDPRIDFLEEADTAGLKGRVLITAFRLSDGAVLRA